MDDPHPRQKTFKRNAHVQYFLRCLRALPTQAQDNDSNRVTIAFFCLSGLELLGALREKTSQEQRDGWADWIWRLQSRKAGFTATLSGEDLMSTASGGFRGSTFMGYDDTSSPGHIPSTYTALMCLAILRAPLDRLDVPALSRFLVSCQSPDGSFSPVPPRWMEDGGFQNDVRMTYCASVIASVVERHDFKVDQAVEYVERCRVSGTSYCSVASLALLADHRAHHRSADKDEETIRWLIQRQIGGFQGRPGKLEDVCYSFWIGGALTILGHGDLVEAEANRAFLLSSQSPMGGFAKEPGEYPDPYHSYLALAALAMMDSCADLELGRLDVKWNISKGAAEWLRNAVERTR